MNYYYTLTDQAFTDLDQICDYLSSFNQTTVNKFLDDFEKKCHNLIKFPEMGKIYSEINQGEQ
jgi:toxin ParE1/3/4